MEQNRPVGSQKHRRRHRRRYLLVAIVIMVVLAGLWAVKARSDTEDTVPPPTFKCRSQAQMVAVGEGKVDCCFRAEAGQTMQTVGALSIRIYGSEDGERWSLERICRYTDDPSLMGTGTDAHQGKVTVCGTPGRYYKAWVIIWAEGETGSQSRSLWTQPVQA